jgi:hypothetical protein
MSAKDEIARTVGDVRGVVAVQRDQFARGPEVVSVSAQQMVDLLNAVDELLVRVSEVVS